MRRRENSRSGGRLGCLTRRAQRASRSTWSTTGGCTSWRARWQVAMLAGSRLLDGELSAGAGMSTMSRGQENRKRLWKIAGNAGCDRLVRRRCGRLCRRKRAARHGSCIKGVAGSERGCKRKKTCRRRRTGVPGATLGAWKSRIQGLSTHPFVMGAEMPSLSVLHRPALFVALGAMTKTPPSRQSWSPPSPQQAILYADANCLQSASETTSHCHPWEWFSQNLERSLDGFAEMSGVTSISATFLGPVY